MAILKHRNPARYAERLEEFAYLTNVLMAGHSVGGRRLRSVEAAQVAINVCSAGLEYLGEGASGPVAPAPAADRSPIDAATLLTEEPADKLFRVGWRLAHGAASRR